jgi:cytochrome b
MPQEVPQEEVVRRSESVRVWDLPTRFFHWTLAGLVLCAWVSYRFAEDLGDVTLVWHRWNGLAILILVLWRLIWGFAGSSTSRFSTFVKGPRAVARYARALFDRDPQRYLGHNPAGAMMILGLLGVLLAQASFGLLAVDDNDLTGGPLHRLVDEATNRWATHWHGFLFEFVILPLTAIHICASALYGLVKGERLVRAMFTGTKPLQTYVDAREAQFVDRPLLRAFGVFIFSACIVSAAILALGGRLPG